jgi:hypothetical protein
MLYLLGSYIGNLPEFTIFLKISEKLQHWALLNEFVANENLLKSPKTCIVQIMSIVSSNYNKETAEEFFTHDRIFIHECFIYLQPSSCLRDRDDIYDYVPPRGKCVRNRTHPDDDNDEDDDDHEDENEDADGDPNNSSYAPNNTTTTNTRQR